MGAPLLLPLAALQSKLRLVQATLNVTALQALKRSCLLEKTLNSMVHLRFTMRYSWLDHLLSIYPANQKLHLGEESSPTAWLLHSTKAAPTMLWP